MNFLSLPRFIIPFFAGLCLFHSVFLFSSVQAVCDGYDPNDPYGLDCGQRTNLTDKDARDVVANLINAALQITGIILVVYIIYAGYLWMTAAGDEDQVGKAKSIISACVMGLILILTSYSIASFVIEKLRNATGT